MTDAEIVALVAREIHQRFPLVLKYEAENLASVAVAALTEAGRLVPETTWEVEGAPDESLEAMVIPPLDTWTERVVEIGYRGSRPYVVIATPAFVPDGCVCIDAGRWERVRCLAAWADVLSAERENDTTIGLRNAKRHIDLQPGDLDTEPTP